jgi:hypothetical protein
MLDLNRPKTRQLVRPPFLCRDEDYFAGGRPMGAANAVHLRLLLLVAIIARSFCRGAAMPGKRVE